MEKVSEVKMKEVSIEVNEKTISRLENIQAQINSLQSIAEATMITCFEQEGIEVPIGASIKLEKNKMSFLKPNE
jgi:hypothetical protein